ncbi:hypothetical protein, partial [Gluconobacter cerinus]
MRATGPRNHGGVNMNTSLLKRNVSLYVTAGLMGAYAPAYAAETGALQSSFKQVSDTIVVLPRQSLKKTVTEISLRMHVPVTIGPDVPDTVYAAPV